MKETSDLSPISFFANNKQHFGMGYNDDFRLIKSSNDMNSPYLPENKKQTHDRYIQTYKGLDVEFADFMIHHRNNRINYINCKVVEGLDLNINPNYTESLALDAALIYLGLNNEYVWLDSNWENSLKAETNDPNATYYPTGQLIIAKNISDGNYSASGYTLAWKFDIASLNPDFDYSIYIDAQTGSIIKKYSKNCEGTAHLMYNYGTNVFIDTKWRGLPNWDYYLYACSPSSGRNICTKESEDRNTTFNDLHKCQDDDDFWDWNRFTATTTHWAVTQTWDYFHWNLGRNGIDNNGGYLRVRAGVDWNNAQFRATENSIIIGYVDPDNNNGYFGALDIVAHEFTHGLDEHHAELVYEREPGALDESFADIFGYMVERYWHLSRNEPNRIDWTIGEDVGIAPIRSLENPFASTAPQPAVYEGTNWFNLAGCTPNQPAYNDFCGVHTNSGVQNYWFYLLSEGSTVAVPGTVNGINVQGIGAEKASWVTIDNMTQFLGSNAQYIDARNGALIAAHNIWGPCSKEYKEVWNAWAAVGIEPEFESVNINGNATIYYEIINGQINILGGMPRTFTAQGYRAPYTWLYNGNWQFNVSGPDNNTFEISSFNNDLNNATIQVNGECGAASETINFINLTSPIYTGGNGGNSLISIFPNPVGSMLNIEVRFHNDDDNNPWIMSIINMDGQTLFQNSYSQELPRELDVSSFISNTYLLVVSKGDNQQVLKFTKR